MYTLFEDRHIIFSSVFRTKFRKMCNKTVLTYIQVTFLNKEFSLFLRKKIFKIFISNVTKSSPQIKTYSGQKCCQSWKLMAMDYLHRQCIIHIRIDCGHKIFICKPIFILFYILFIYFIYLFIYLLFYFIYLLFLILFYWFFFAAHTTRNSMKTYE